MKTFSSNFVTDGTSAIRREAGHRISSGARVESNVVRFPGDRAGRASGCASARGGFDGQSATARRRAASRETEPRAPRRGQRASWAAECAGYVADTTEMMAESLRTGSFIGSYAQDYSKVDAKVWAVILAAVTIGIALV